MADTPQGPPLNSDNPFGATPDGQDFVDYSNHQSDARRNTQWLDGLESILGGGYISMSQTKKTRSSTFMSLGQSFSKMVAQPQQNATKENTSSAQKTDNSEEHK